MYLSIYKCRTNLVPGILRLCYWFWGQIGREREQTYIWLQYKAPFFLDRILNLQDHKITNFKISVTLDSLAMTEAAWPDLSCSKYHSDKIITAFPWLEPYSDGDRSLIPHSYLLGWKVYGEWSLDVSTVTCCWPLASYNKAEQMRHVSNEIQTLLPRLDWVPHRKDKHCLQMIFLMSYRAFKVNYFPKEFKCLIDPKNLFQLVWGCLFTSNYNLLNKPLTFWGQMWLGPQ